MEPPKENFRADVAHIGKSVLVKGELSGSEDLYLDGELVIHNERFVDKGLG